MVGLRRIAARFCEALTSHYVMKSEAEQAHHSTSPLKSLTMVGLRRIVARFCEALTSHYVMKSEAEQAHQ